MSDPKFAVTEFEAECGVTLKQVKELSTKVLMRANGTKIVFPVHTSAALASSTTRFILGDYRSPGFLGLNSLGQPVYGFNEGNADV